MKKVLILVMITVLVLSTIFTFSGCEKEEVEPIYEIQIKDPNFGFFYYLDGGFTLRYEYQYDEKPHIWDGYVVYYADGDKSKEGEIVYSIIFSQETKKMTIQGDDRFSISYSIEETLENGNRHSFDTPPSDRGKYILKYFYTNFNSVTMHFMTKDIQIDIYII